jgi:spermidine synthase
MTRVSVFLTSLLLATTSATNDEIATKRIEEVEDEIGYIQSLVVKIPPMVTFESNYQEIEVYESDNFGKVFILDECLQLTEKDAPHYNEMLAHVPMMEYLATHSNPEPMRVLVLGGGDGYVVSELLKYSNIESIDHVELDEGVINISKQFFDWSSAWEHDKVNLIIGDGAEFVMNQLQEGGKNYHVIIQDASDPYYTDSTGSVVTLPSHVLYEDEHFEIMHKLLKPNSGILMFQAETYNIPSNLDEIRSWRGSLENIGFDHIRYGSISISTYPTGQIGFFVSHSHEDNDDMICKSDACGENLETPATNKMDVSDWMDWNRVWASFRELNGKTKYYHPRIHKSSFDLPLWVEEAIYGKLL